MERQLTLPSHELEGTITLGLSRAENGSQLTTLRLDFPDHPITLQ